MRLSRERLQREAATTGFRVEILEKVAHLLELLDFPSHRGVATVLPLGRLRPTGLRPE